MTIEFETLWDRRRGGRGTSSRRKVRSDPRFPGGDKRVPTPDNLDELDMLSMEKRYSKDLIDTNYYAVISVEPKDE